MLLLYNILLYDYTTYCLLLMDIRVVYSLEVYKFAGMSILVHVSYAH